jgi:hypothetical protein
VRVSVRLDDDDGLGLVGWVSGRACEGWRVKGRCQSGVVLRIRPCEVATRVYVQVVGTCVVATCSRTSVDVVEMGIVYVGETACAEATCLQALDDVGALW